MVRFFMATTRMSSRGQVAALTTALFKALEQGQASAVASSISLLEILVHPYRQGRPDFAGGLRGLLSSLPSLRTRLRKQSPIPLLILEDAVRGRR